MDERVVVTGRPRRDRPKSARTRNRILGAAATLLSERGYVATRIGDVAELAEMQGPALYYHFASRDELIEEVIATGQRGVLEHVTEALTAASLDPMQRILTAVGAHLEYVLTTSSFASASIRNFAQLPEEIQERQLRLRQSYGDVWRGLFQDAARRGVLDPALDVHAARMLVIGALNWTCEWWDPGRGTLADLITAASGFVRAALTARVADLGSTEEPPLTVADSDSDVDGRKSARSRRRILDAAARVLSRRGYAGTRLSDVAAEADMQAASLYYHFGSREELIEEVVREGVRRTHGHVTGVLAALPTDATPLDRLDRAVTAHLSFCLRFPDATIATIRNARQLPPELAERQRAAESEYGDVWRALLDAAAANGVITPGTDLSVLRMLLLGALNQTTEWSDRTRSPDTIVTTARAMIRNAVTGVPAGTESPSVKRPLALAPLFFPPGA